MTPTFPLTLRALRRAAGATLAVALLSSCATSVITPEVEDQLGEQMAVQVAEQIGLYPDPELNRYVQEVGARLVEALGPTPYTFRFAVVDQFEPNAFATPGGFIYISRGLLSQVNHEAELAGVLAHEISHVTRRHHARQVGRSIGAGLFTLPGRAVGVISQDLGNMINAPVEAAGQVYLSSFSRSQETEADQYGMRLAASAGYQPHALADALEGIERAVTYLTGEQRQPSFFDSHPTTPTRVADIERHAGSLQVADRPPLANHEQLLGHLDGLWAGPQNPQQGVFNGQSFYNADYDFTLTFPADWKTINTPRFVGASAQDRSAFIALSGAPPEATLQQLADAAEANMREGTGLEPSVRQNLELGDWPAELVRYDDSSGEETVSLYYLFVQSPQHMFTVLAMGLEHQRPALRQTVTSLRGLNSAERNGISGQRLRIARGDGNSPVGAVGARNGNVWSPEYTAIVNGLESAAARPAGPLKIARKERYRP